MEGGPPSLQSPGPRSTFLRSGRALVLLCEACLDLSWGGNISGQSDSPGSPGTGSWGVGSTVTPTEPGAWGQLIREPLKVWRDAGYLGLQEVTGLWAGPAEGSSWRKLCLGGPWGPSPAPYLGFISHSPPSQAQQWTKSPQFPEMPSGTLCPQGLHAATSGYKQGPWSPAGLRPITASAGAHGAGHRKPLGLLDGATQRSLWLRRTLPGATVPFQLPTRDRETWVLPLDWTSPLQAFRPY